MLAESAKMEKMGISKIYWIDVSFDLSSLIAAHVDELENEEGDIITGTTVHFETGMTFTIIDEFEEFTKVWDKHRNHGTNISE
jgi:hypothetical protein